MIARLTAAALMILWPLAGIAQTNIALGGLNADPTEAVEITADQLTVDQDSRSATFAGNVIIGQGELRIAAGNVRVVYDDASGQIAQLMATGGVTLVTATEAAEAQSAEYDLTTGLLTMTGDVLLTQGASALSADRMVVNLTANTAQMDGRVRTVFQQGNN
ncbi:LptA/OstA family protein [Flavimaricola marinus]|uniref:Lipopolysaccharide transport periplasmic protein LptA n=1 Tax=Flavimaricola marinus TaxID=1819565 RepID=A0A238LBI2_9RHOB|nr:LptA/OstA family protein [Flavimaricola marinus]SMY07097.1 lipopolysaccharide transport periplasmic protein LptA [Flavimaricola marinus]